MKLHRFLHQMIRRTSDYQTCNKMSLTRYGSFVEVPGTVFLSSGNQSETQRDSGIHEQYWTSTQPYIHATAFANVRVSMSDSTVLSQACCSYFWGNICIIQPFILDSHEGWPRYKKIILLGIVRTRD